MGEESRVPRGDAGGQRAAATRRPAPTAARQPAGAARKPARRDDASAQGTARRRARPRGTKEYTLRLPEDLHAALRLRKAVTGEAMGDVMVGILREALADEAELARRLRGPRG